MSEPRMTATEALKAAVVLKGRRVADIGCGDGGIARFMTREGAHVTGVDNNPVQLGRAAKAEPAGDERYVEGTGEEMPLPDASADVVVFMNSLHHVPVGRQDDALKEAARVLVDGGDLYIAEPLAEGPQFEMTRPVEDETEIRAAAYEAIGRAAQYGFEPVFEKRHLQTRTVKSFEALREGHVAINPARAARFDALEPEMRAAFARVATPLPEGGFELVQPIRTNLFRRRPRG